MLARTGKRIIRALFANAVTEFATMFVVGLAAISFVLDVWYLVK